MTDRAPTRRDALVVSAFVCALAAPFLGKPAHNDEPYFLFAARHILSDPLHPTRFYCDWLGRRLPFAKVSSNPPLFYYLIAAPLKLCGDRLAALRLCLLPLDVIAAVALLFVAARYLRRPLLPTLTVLAGPAYAINMEHLMGEKGAAAFGFAGLALMLAGLDAGGGPLLWSAAALIAASCLCKFHAALIFLPVAAWAAARALPRRRAVAFVAAAVLPVALYAGADAVSSGVVAATARTLAMTARLPTAAWPHRLRALLAFVGGCGGAAAAWPLLARRPSAATLALLLAVMAALYAPWLDRAPAALLDRACGVVWAAAAAWSLRLVWARRRDKEAELLVVWSAAALAACAAYWSVTSRLVLFALPPLALVAASELERRWSEGALRRLHGVSLAATAGLTILLAFVDLHFAQAQRDFAFDVQRTYLRAGRRVWHTSTMGLEYYLAGTGARGLDADRGGWDLVRPGDVVLRLAINSAGVNPRKPVRVVEKAYTVQEPIPLRLISGWTGEAGFYSSFWGFLPYCVSREPLERFAALEVQ